MNIIYLLYIILKIFEKPVCSGNSMSLALDLKSRNVTFFHEMVPYGLTVIFKDFNWLERLDVFFAQLDTAGFLISKIVFVTKLRLANNGAGLPDQVHAADFNCQN